MDQNKKRRFLFALDADKKKGIQPPSQTLAAPMAGGVKPMMPAAPGPAPMPNTAPVPVTHMPMPAGPKITPQSLMATRAMASKPSMNPVAAPGLPAMGNLPKFGKMRNSLKGGPYKKSNKA